MEAIGVSCIFNFVGFPIGSEETKGSPDDYRFIVGSLVYKFTGFFFFLSIALLVTVMITVDSYVVIFFLFNYCDLVRVLLWCRDGCDEKQRQENNLKF